MKKRKWLRSTTWLLFALIITTLGIGTYCIIYRNLSVYERQVQIMQKDLLINFQMKVDEILDIGTKKISNWALDSRVIQFASEKELDYYNAVKIYEELCSDGVLPQDIDCVYGVFRPDLDMFITNRGVLHYEHLQKKYDFVPGGMSYIKELQEKDFTNNLCLSRNLSTKHVQLNLFFRRHSVKESMVDVYGFISLNLQKLTKRMSQLENGTFMALMDGEPIFSSNTSFDNAKMDILTEPSDVVYNLSYAIGNVKRNHILVWLCYGLLLIPLALAGLYGSFVLAKRLHRPIENILSQISEEEADIYDEEAYIRKRFVEIETVNQQLSGRIRAQEQYLKQNFVRDLLYGLVPEAELSEKARDYNLPNLCGHVVMAVLEENKSEAQGAVFFNQIAALLETKIENSIAVFLNSEQIAVISVSTSCEAFQKSMIQAILQIDEWYDVSYTGAVSEGDIDSLEQLSGIFNETMRYLQNGDFSYDMLIITKKDLLEREEYRYYYPLEFEKNIIHYIANREFDHAMQMVKLLLEKNLVEMKLGKAALTELKFAFVGTVKRALQVLKKSEAELFGEGSILYLELSASKTPEEISDKVCEMFSSICTFAEDVYNSSNYELIDMLEAFIQENYRDEDMSLLLLAEHFNLTTGYISRIFKKCRQVNFKDYLSAYRIEKATEIMNIMPDVRISELAKQVGYDNVQRFVRNFKKLKQVSPSEYREKIKEKIDE